MKSNSLLWFSLGALFANSITLFREGDHAYGAFFLILCLTLAFVSGWYGNNEEKPR